jgi:hypothetical protein
MMLDGITSQEACGEGMAMPNGAVFNKQHFSNNMKLLDGTIT